MAKLLVMPNQTIVNGMKGKVDFYLWMGIPVARRWPRSPGPRRAPLVEAQWPRWTYATRIWNTLSSVMQDAWRETARNTGLTGRDLQIKAYIEGYITKP